MTKRITVALINRTNREDELNSILFNLQRKALAIISKTKTDEALMYNLTYSSLIKRFELTLERMIDNDFMVYEYGNASDITIHDFMLV